MRKRLLFSVAAAMTALSSFALEVGEFVYTPQGRFQITDATNAFTGVIGTGFSGFESVGGAVVNEAFTFGTDDAVGSYLQSLSTLENTKGMSYKMQLQGGETYVVSFKVASSSVSSSHNQICSHAGTTGMNKISVFSTAGNYTDEVNTWYSAAETITPEWTTCAFAVKDVDAAKAYFIDFVGMNADVKVADIQIQKASQVADIRVKDYTVGLLTAYKNTFKEWTEELEAETGLNEMIESFSVIKETSTQGALDALVLDVPTVLASVRVYMDDLFKSNPDSKLPVGKRDDKAAVSGLFSLLPRGMRGIRVDSKTYNDSYRYLGGYSGSQTSLWNGVAGIEYTDFQSFAPGRYVFSLDACGGVTETTSGSCYDNNVAHKFNAVMYVLNEQGDTVATSGSYKIGTSAALYENDDDFTSNFVSFVVPEQGKYKIGFKTLGYPYDGVTGGGRILVKEANLYGISDLEYSDNQLRYIASVQGQINAGTENLATAKNYVASSDYYWGKAELQACIDTITSVVEKYEAIYTDSAFIVQTLAEYEENGGTWNDGKDVTKEEAVYAYTIYSEIKDLIAANKRFVTLNDSLALIPEAIAGANVLLAERTYSASTQKDQLVNAINTANGVYESLKSEGYSEENIQKINEQLALIDEAKTVYMNGLTDDMITTLVDIDFSEAAVKSDDTNNYDAQGAEVSISGAAGSMLISNFMTSNPPAQPETASKDKLYFPYQLGCQINGADTLASVLRVGQGDATVEFDAGEIGTNIIKVSMDWYFGRLSGCNVGFYLLDENSENVSGLYFSPYDSGMTYNPLSLTGWKSDEVGFAANTAGNAEFVKDANKTSMTLYLDYGTKKAKLVSVIKAGEYSTDWVDFNGQAVKTFKLSSNYNYAEGRRCWFDNLKIEKITAGAATTIGDVNGDDAVTMADANAIVNYYLAEDKSTVTGFNADAADMNGDGDITMADANAVVNMFLGQE